MGKEVALCSGLHLKANLNSVMEKLLSTIRQQMSLGHFSHSVAKSEKLGSRVSGI